MSRHAIRRAGKADAALLAALHGEAFPDPWSAEDFAGFLDTGAIGLIAEEAGEGAGFVLLRLAGGEGEVLTVCVRPARRREGWGRALLEGAREAARAAGAELLFLEVGEGNAAARALYRAAGFVSVGRRPSYYRERDELGRPAGRSAAIIMRASIL